MSRYNQDYRGPRGGMSRGWYTEKERDYGPDGRYQVDDYRNRESPPERYIRERSPRNFQNRSYRDNVRDYREKSRNYDYDNENYESYDNYDSGYGSNRRSDRSRSRERARYNDREDSRERREKRYTREDAMRDRRRQETDRYDDYERTQSRERTDKQYRGSDYRDDDYNRNDSTGGNNAPCSTVIVQGLTPHANEMMIENALKQDGVRAKQVSVIRDRNNESKGYAFVEFEDMFDAEAWLKISKRVIFVDGQRAYLNYSRSKKAEPSAFPDWYCSECKVLNFGSRRKHDKVPTCFQCGVVRKEPEASSLHDDKSQGDSKSESKLEPCNVLMIRGMDFATTEDTIRNEISKLTSYAVYDVRLIRDKVTDMSRGFAFVELGSTEHASELLEKIEQSDPPVEIEGRKIAVGFARHGYNAPLNGKKSKSIKQTADKQAFADNAFAAANAAGSTQYSQTSATDTLQQSTGVSTAGQMGAGTTATYQQADLYSYYQQPANQSTYTYDPTTGYYYDSSTGLYYDANSGYYYNGTTGQYLYWNGTRYQAVNQDGTPVQQNQTAAKPPEPEQKDTTTSKVDDKSKVNLHGQKPKNARKIAKDMERWAKKMNTANEARKVAVKQAQDELKMLEQKEEELRKKIQQEKTIVNTLDIAQQKDGVKSLFVPDNDEEGSILKLGSALQAPTNTKPPKSISLVPDIPDDDDDDVTDEMKFVDTVKMACLLCKRQFPNHDVLTKHLQMSQLHKQNMEKYRQTKKF